MKASASGLIDLGPILLVRYKSEGGGLSIDTEIYEIRRYPVLQIAVVACRFWREVNAIARRPWRRTHG
jgi:hypothetical protein